MGVAVVPDRLCAVCASKPATRSMVVDYRVFMVCKGCKRPDVPDVDEDERPARGASSRSPLRDEVTGVLRCNPGMLHEDLADVLRERAGLAIGDESYRLRNNITNLVKRMAIEGHIRRERRPNGGNGYTHLLWLANDRRAP